MLTNSLRRATSSVLSWPLDEYRKLERDTEIESVSEACKTSAQPLDQSREIGSGAENRTPVIALRGQRTAD
jgi:hypothetical protein